MSFTDWHTGHNLSLAGQGSTFIHTSTIEGFAHTPSPEEQTRDAVQKAATGRRSWKTVRGGSGEAVWSPQLEAALIEGLEKYHPDTSKAKTLGRFPMRNRFISDYIFQATGKRRTPKQVGSRIQQLRDTCKGENILRLISRTSGSPGPSSPSPSPDSDDSPCPSPPEISPEPNNGQSTDVQPAVYRRVDPAGQLLVNVILGGASNAGPPYIDLAYAHPQQITLTASVGTLHLVDPQPPALVTSFDYNFVVLSSVPLQDWYDILFIECTTRRLHCAEACRLDPSSHVQMGSHWTYRVALTQQYWSLLNDQPGRFIVQHSFKTNIQPPLSVRSPISAGEINVLYRFAKPQRVHMAAVPANESTNYTSYTPMSSSSHPAYNNTIEHQLSGTPSTLSSMGYLGHGYGRGQDPRMNTYPYY